MSTESLITAWGWIYGLGLGTFFVVAVVLIPLGARDVWRLYQSVSDESGEGKR
ncbi:MAG: hypothetical protein P8R42_05525 [Candidatus Binatia bacterium]|nr:hypothetical protein [Candidatus Binatia bacterium]